MKKRTRMIIRTICLSLILVFCSSAFPQVAVPVLAAEINKLTADLLSPFPSGFIAGDPACGNWAYIDNDEYLAVLFELPDGSYLFSYAKRDVNSPVYELIVPATELSLVSRYILTLNQDLPVKNAVDVSASFQTEIRTASTRGLDDYEEVVKEMMQEEYGATYQNREVYYDFDWGENPVSLLCTYTITESKSYDAVAFDVIAIIAKGISIASAGVLIAQKFAFKVTATIITLSDVLSEADLVSTAAELLFDIEVKRCRGFLNYVRVGSAQTTGEAVQHYNVTATKNIIYNYMIIDIPSSNLRDDLHFVDDDLVYLPSAEEAEYSYMIERVRELHN